MNKYMITPLKQRFRSLWIGRNQLEEWMTNWKFFFILGFGRSGTAFLADLLNSAPGAYVFHEPVLEDIPAHLRAHYDAMTAVRYLNGFRWMEICTRMRGQVPGVYGEVNSHLRCHVAAIKHTLPRVTLIHIVRDGRNVVRSTIPRRMMTPRNPFSLMIHPLNSDPWYSYWSKMDRFARLCWYWQEENRRLRMNIGQTIQLEKILTNYGYFHDEVLVPLGIEVDQKTWQAATASPRNATTTHQMPKWDDWTPEQQHIFREICGDEMAKYGYEF